MGLGEMPLFSALKAKMQWHQERQTLLAENVANADTPSFQGRDLKPFSIETAASGVTLRTVAPAGGQKTSGHMPLTPIAGTGAFASRLNSFEVTPERNGVTLEEEMMKVTANQLDYQAATTLYSRSVRILKLALGRSA